MAVHGMTLNGPVYTGALALRDVTGVVVLLDLYAVASEGGATPVSHGKSKAIRKGVACCARAHAAAIARWGLGHVGGSCTPYADGTCDDQYYYKKDADPTEFPPIEYPPIFPNQ